MIDDEIPLMTMNFGNWPVLENVAMQVDAGLRGNMDYVLNLNAYASDLSEIIQTSNFIRERFSHVLVLGTGGSSLCGQALGGLVKGQNFWQGATPEVTFLDNIDPDSIRLLADNIDYSETMVLIISKSGGTMETIAQAAIILDEMQQACGQNALKEQVIAISDPKDSLLRRMAERHGFKVLQHEEQIGGRYSIFTNVGLLPAAIMGMDIEAIISGAKQWLDTNLVQTCKSSAAHADMMKKGIRSSVVMPYVDRLQPLVNWWRQVWAESLGRNGIGITPITALGTVDQHSQLQLYLDGYKDKSFTLITLEQKGLGFEIPFHILNDPDAGYMNGKKIGDLMQAAQDATYESILSLDLPVRRIHLTHLDEEVIGALAMQFMLETILTAKIIGVNPYGQPAVEDGKKRAMQKLS